jgi:hypothetical protein
VFPPETTTEEEEVDCSCLTRALRRYGYRGKLSALSLEEDDSTLRELESKGKAHERDEIYSTNVWNPVDDCPT